MSKVVFLCLAVYLVVAAPTRYQQGPPGRFVQLSLRRLWTRSVAPNADSAGAYLAHPRRTSTPLVYVLAGNNGSNCSPGDPVRTATLYAFQASTGRPVWSRSTSGPSRCTTAGPVADPSGQWVYAPGLDGKVHRYNALTGQETTGTVWPRAVTLMPDVEKVPSNLTIGTHHLYVATSGFIGDAGHYQGHLVSIDLRTGRSAVFNSLCSNVATLLGPTAGRSNYCSSAQSGLFGRGQGTVDPVTHDVYVVSGNGPWNGHTNWGDSVLKLDPSGSRLLDAYTPPNQASLSSGDADLGSTGPAMLPTVRQGRHSYHLLVQGGKGPACDSCSGVALRLLNRDNLSGEKRPGHLGGELQDIPAPGNCEVLTAPAVWKSPSGAIWVIYANDCGIAGYRLSSPSPAKFRLTLGWSVGTGGTTPVISRNVVYVAREGLLRALDPASGKVLWSGAGIGGVHWEYPLLAGGRLFMTDQSGHLSAFTIRGGFFVAVS